MKRPSIIFFVQVFPLFILANCTHVMTSNIGKNLAARDVFKTYGTRPLNLGQKFKCRKDQAIKLVSVETRTAPICKNKFVHTYCIIPKDLSGHAVAHFKCVLKQMNVPLNDDSTRVVKLRLVDFKFTKLLVPFVVGVRIGLKLIIDEIHFSKVVTKTETSGFYERCIANAIHLAVMELVSDSAIQNYILCLEPPQKAK